MSKIILKSGMPSLHEASKTDSSKYLLGIETDPSRSVASDKMKILLQLKAH
jgi:hypothetical protein